MHETDTCVRHSDRREQGRAVKAQAAAVPRAQAEAAAQGKKALSVKWISEPS